MTWLAPEFQEVLERHWDPEPSWDLPEQPPLPDHPAGEAVIAELRRAVAIEAGRAGMPDPHHVKAARRARYITEEDYLGVIALANGSVGSSRILTTYDLAWLASAAPSLSLLHLLRLHRAKEGATVLRAAAGITARTDATTDLRLIEEAVQRAGLQVDLAGLITSRSITARAAWPWLASRPDLLSRWLRGSLAESRLALEALSCFPHPPRCTLPDLARIALGEDPALRKLAHQAMGAHPAALELARYGLTYKSGKVRSAAAEWLAAQGDPAGVPPLRTALSAERLQPVRAVIVTALAQLGADLRTELSPAALLLEATLARRLPAAQDWLTELSLPELQWLDSARVDERIPRWWLHLAVQLKSAAGTGLLASYLDRLTPASAADLGRAALWAWIGRDTRHPPEAESRSHAALEGPRLWRSHQAWLARARSDPGTTAEELELATAAAAIPEGEVTARVYREHQATYLGSAITEKGLLALTTFLPAGELASAALAYFQVNPFRRAQSEALVTALHAHGGLPELQVVFAVARRFRLASVSALAGEFVAELAAAKGWTADELGDRTIPTAGFGDDGILRLDYGNRQVTGRVTQKGGIALQTSDRTPLTSLPAARVTEDPELVAFARGTLSTARRVLKSVLTEQTSRLYEAMCCQRTWPAQDWQSTLAVHPLLVAPLLSRLVWTASTPEGTSSFRPSEDGPLLTLEGDELHLSPDATVRLAHRVVCGDPEASSWRQHLADFEVRPLFEQFSSPPVRIGDQRRELSDLAGHVCDTFGLRRAAQRRGYRRHTDGEGWFDTYLKPFPSLGMRAELTFSGSYLPEQNRPCSTGVLRFSTSSRRLLLTEVPPVLLAECRTDYAALAALGPYDPDHTRRAW